jgi:hypothetical protein
MYTIRKLRWLAYMNAKHGELRKANEGCWTGMPPEPCWLQLHWEVSECAAQSSNEEGRDVRLPLSCL